MQHKRLREVDPLLHTLEPLYKVGRSVDLHSVWQIHITFGIVEGLYMGCRCTGKHTERLTMRVDIMEVDTPCLGGLVLVCYDARIAVGCTDDGCCVIELCRALLRGERCDTQQWAM